MQQDEKSRGIKLTTGQAISGVVVIFIVSALLTYGVIITYQPDVAERPAEDVVTQAENYHELQQAVKIILQEHIDEDITAETLIEGAVRGAVEATGDRYSMYFDASELKDFMEQTIEGEYSGIGVSVLNVDGYVTVMVPFQGSPAATTPFEGADEDDPVGLQSGDRIVKVDGLDVVGMSTEHVAEIIRGPVGEEVTIVIERGNDEDKTQLTFEIERAQIEIPTVTSDVVDGDVGLLTISQFTGHTGEQLQEHVAKLQEKGVSGLIIDLRFNPGGDLAACVEAADVFIPEGPVMIARGRGDESEVVQAQGEEYHLPIVVLVNEFSASGAEILAGALRDRLGSPLIGQTTFGKGAVQRMWYLDRDKPSGMKITTAQYLTPDEYSIEDEGGLTPDYEVEWPDDGEQGNIDRDPQLRRAFEVLREKTNE